MAGLQATISKVVTPEVVETIIKAQVSKAEKGDPGAARFVLDLYAASQSALPPADPPAKTPKQQRIQTTATNGEDLRRKVMRCVKNLGKATPGQIAANLLVSVDDVERILLENGAYRRCPSANEFFEVVA